MLVGDIEIDYRFIWRKLANMTLIIPFVHAISWQTFFTKALSKEPFTTIPMKLDVHNHSLLHLKETDRDNNEDKTKRREDREDTSTDYFTLA